MRKLFSILSVALVALFAVGCDKQNGDITNTTNAAFEFQNAKVTTTTAEVQVVPADETALYFAAIVEASEIAELNDTEIIAKFTDAQDISFTKGKKTLPQSLHQTLSM